jgi:hypothetical protein
MMTAFNLLFKIERNNIQCFLNGATNLHTATLYGLLFEPYFHSLVCGRGYSGRMRLLTPSNDLNKGKRSAFGTKRTGVETRKHRIPLLRMTKFHQIDEIVSANYNVPDRKDFVAIDSLAPALGEMYQVTSAEERPIKVDQLQRLKRCFQSHIDAGQKVKLIFIVPPNRFDTYVVQKYVDTNSKGEKTKVRKEILGPDPDPIMAATPTAKQSMLRRMKSAVMLKVGAPKTTPTLDPSTDPNPSDQHFDVVVP